MRLLPNVLVSRHGVYYLRLYHAGRETKLSLRTKDYPVARLAALRFLLERSMTGFRKFEVDIAQGIFKTNGTQEDAKALQHFLEHPDIALRMKSTSLPPVAPAPAGPPPIVERAPKKLFREAIEQYLDVKTRENVTKTLNEKRSVFANFHAANSGIDTNNVLKAHAVAFKMALLNEGAGNSQLNKKLSYLKDFFDFAVGHGYYDGANPFLGLSVNKRGVDSISYDEFTDEELIKIFGPEYVLFMNRPNLYWLPLMALFSGARINEIAGLRLDEVFQDSGVWVMSIPIARAKNQQSVRKIPIHPRLITLGFLDYVSQIRCQEPENGLVFPELLSAKRLAKLKADPRMQIDYGKNAGRRFGQLLDRRSVGIKSRTKVFHSFRATLINRLTNVVGIHPAHILGIVGHTGLEKIDTSTPHFTSYQKKKPIQYLEDSIKRLRYDFLEQTAVFKKELPILATSKVRREKRSDESPIKRHLGAKRK